MSSTISNRSKGKERLDKLLVDLGLVVSRERARALIMAGQVVVNDHLAEKAGQLVDLSAQVRLKEDLPFVSRGGLKLQQALDTFGISVEGLVALDVGASTGGFTDCLLQRGARRVFAVDVGYGQLAWKLRQDPRVLNLEKTNIRYLEPDLLPEVPDLAVIDASFISLSKVLPNSSRLLKPQGFIVALIKPQFEVGPGEVGKGGVVRDPGKHQAVIQSVRELASSMGLQVNGVVESPILGPKGNREFLIYLQKDHINTQDGTMEQCLFCKICAGTLPAKTVYADEHLIAIEDINPAAPQHLLLIPKKHIVSVLDLQEADDQLVGHMMRVAAQLARDRGVADEGFRIVANTNEWGGQSVFHLHFHLLAGRQMHWPPG